MLGTKELGDALPDSIIPVLHVEVCQKACSTARASVLAESVKALLMDKGSIFGDYTRTEFSDSILRENVDSISIQDVSCNVKVYHFSSAQLIIHVFRLHSDGPDSDELDEDGGISVANHWVLPNLMFHGLWENLIFDNDIKQKLIKYTETTLLFSDRGVDPNVLSCNRVILLHGPPGTGKTSLCKALAHKLCIHLSERYLYGKLIEINSHSLFSKWFSESGKLVQKMFQKIQEVVDDPKVLVCVLIDEVESLTAARNSAMSGNDPSDAIRVVNALLTQIDHIKRFSNVLILTTSNITGAIDAAFIDRADIKQYIGFPSLASIFRIYQSCIKELMRVNIISPAQQILDLRALEMMHFMENDATKLSLMLRDISRKSEGLSCRTLRKIPFLAHSIYSQMTAVSLEHFLNAMEKTVLEHSSSLMD